MSVVVCQVEGLGPPVLTRWHFYEVLGEATKPTPVIRVRADDGQARWFPASLFAAYPAEPPRLVGWQFDEPVTDVECACVEVSVDLADGTRRWCNFATPKWLEWRLSVPEQCPVVPLENIVVVLSLAPEHIEGALRDLEHYKGLTSATRPLPPYEDDEKETVAEDG